MTKDKEYGFAEATQGRGLVGRPGPIPSTDAIEEAMRRVPIPMSQRLRREDSEDVIGRSGFDPPTASHIGQLSARGIDKITFEAAEQIRQMGEQIVTYAETIRNEANALADALSANGREFSERVAKFSATVDGMVASMADQRNRLDRSV